MDTKEFTVKFPEAALDDLRNRLQATRWPEELAGAGWAYGVPVSFVRGLVEYWLTGYDPHRIETLLNRYPQFMTTIDGQTIHFLHVRSPEPGAFPLILTHGWPGSVIEYLDVISPLTDPRSHGLDPGQAFHLVIPSIPGFGFSGPTREAGWNRYRIAGAWAELMNGLGYGRYGAVGNDAGAMIVPELARIDPGHVTGMHVTQVFSFPSGDPSEFIGMSEEEQAGMKRLQWFMDTMSGFNKLQSTQPQTLAFALADSPAGLLAWNAQLFGEGVDRDFIIDNVTLYWLTGTSASSTRLYYEDAHAFRQPAEPTTTPLGLAMFEGDFISIRRFAERDHGNIVRWSGYPGGGHYAAHLVPDILAADIRSFFSRVNAGITA